MTRHVFIASRRDAIPGVSHPHRDGKNAIPPCSFPLNFARRSCTKEGRLPSALPPTQGD